MAAPPKHEDELVAALKAGEARAFDTFVRTHSPRMLSVCRRILRDQEEARDAVQEAFLSAFRALPSFEGASQIGTWLHRIAVNAALMRLRARRRKPEESIDSLQPGFTDKGLPQVEPRDWTPSALHLVEQRETRDIVRGCIDRLPEIYRLVVILRDIEQLDTAETASVLGVTPSVVKVRLHRAHHALRSLLAIRFRERTP